MVDSEEWAFIFYYASISVYYNNSYCNNLTNGNYCSNDNIRITTSSGINNMINNHEDSKGNFNNDND